MSVSRPTLIPPALYCALAPEAASRTQRAAPLRIVVIVSSSSWSTVSSNAQVIDKLAVARTHLLCRQRLLHLAIHQQRVAVSERQREVQILLHEQHRHAFR